MSQQGFVRVGQSYPKILSSNGHSYPKTSLPSSKGPGIYRTRSTPSLSQQMQSTSRSRPFIIRSTSQASSLSPCGEDHSSQPPNAIHQQVRPAASSQSPKRQYNVGLARTSKRIDLALSSKNNAAKLRRYEQVFEDPLCRHERFTEDLEVIEEEFKRLRVSVEKEEQEYLRRRQLEDESRKNSMKAHDEFLRQAVENQKLAAMRKQEELLEAQRRRRVANEKLENNRRRIWKMKTAAQLFSADAGEIQDEVNENGEVDLRKSRVWNPHFMWLCDIEEKPGDKQNDFLFLADLAPSRDGIRSKTSQRSGRCIFDDVMYDLQKFEPDYKDDGMIIFTLTFGVNTEERKNAPRGWNIDFQVRSREKGGYIGTCSTSWWGSRDVTILPYSSVSDEERAKFPDPVAKYYKTRS